ncbi:hypothetical protein [Xanthocytophaga agilis]|uniref:Uncharacterized protein n=1 Tax=Xanthocytophaga agilis TaxID=3048010 RepID=A0AAE3UB41_9BACT|nr:hypothetical protein [Xanthocytophaga agilis]MDJ1499408.1 hypothetical protein [Xanthocytophaga agilis]
MHTRHTPTFRTDNEKTLIVILEEIEKLAPYMSEAHTPVALQSLIGSACDTINGFALEPEESLTCLARKRLLTALEGAQALMVDACQQRQVDDMTRISSEAYLSIDMYRRTM